MQVSMTGFRGYWMISVGERRVCGFLSLKKEDKYIFILPERPSVTLNHPWAAASFLLDLLMEAGGDISEFAHRYYGALNLPI